MKIKIEERRICSTGWAQGRVLLERERRDLFIRQVVVMQTMSRNDHM